MMRIHCRVIELSAASGVHCIDGAWCSAPRQKEMMACVSHIDIVVENDVLALFACFFSHQQTHARGAMTGFRFAREIIAHLSDEH
jgi:hypothetical protein